MSLFDTPNELPYVTSAKEWERLSSEEFWIHALLSESCRFNRELAKAADTKDDTKYQSRGVVNMQAITDVVNPALTTLPLQQVHIYFPVGFLDVVLPKLTSPPYMMNMREQPAGSPILAQTENHYIILPDALMPHTPVCNEMYEAALMNPASADRIWYMHKCNLKLAVTMFKSEELECSINSLSARRLVVPKPAPASSTAQTIGCWHRRKWIWARLLSNSKTERLTHASSKIQTTSCAQMAVTARDHGLILHADFNMEKLQAPPRNVNYISLKSPYWAHSLAWSSVTLEKRFPFWCACLQRLA